MDDVKPALASVPWAGLVAALIEALMLWGVVGRLSEFVGVVGVTIAVTYVCEASDLVRPYEGAGMRTVAASRLLVLVLLVFAFLVFSIGKRAVAEGMPGGSDVVSAGAWGYWQAGALAVIIAIVSFSRAYFSRPR